MAMIDSPNEVYYLRVTALFLLQEHYLIVYNIPDSSDKHNTFYPSRFSYNRTITTICLYSQGYVLIPT